MTYKVKPSEGKTIQDEVKWIKGLVRTALLATTKTAAAEIEQRGRVEIAQGGRFGRNFVFSFHAQRLAKKRAKATIIRVWDTLPFFNIFEEGGVVRGKPLLWIPISTQKERFKLTSPQAYGAGLFSRRKGSNKVPLLMAKVGGEALPMFFGVPSVTIPKKFDTLSIIKDVNAKIPGMYADLLRSKA